MKKELTLILALSLSLVLLAPTHVSAKHDKKNVTPYGDFCDRVSHYGIHKHNLSDKDVREALKHYFGEKGLNFEIVISRGRFVKAIIKDKNDIIDTIIFDRNTGRIRSVH
jgi:hypothetical protein